MNSEGEIINYPYFRRSNAYGLKFENYNTYQHKYTLLGIARNDIFSTEIFLNYFHSIYTKQYYLQFQQPKQFTRLQRCHVSHYFLLFLRLICLRSLINMDKALSVAINAVINDIYNTKCDKVQSKRLIIFIKSQINDIFEGEYCEFFKKQRGDYLKLALEVETKIKKQIRDMQEELQNPLRLQKIKKQEILPKFSNKFLVQFIKYNFRCINNIQILRKSSKKEVFEEFYNINKYHMQVKIPLIFDTFDTNSNANNTIILPKYTLQTEPVLTQIVEYVNNFDRSQHLAIRSILAELSKSIFQKCSKYHENTKMFYPKFSIYDVFMDQKKLTPFISYNSLLLDAIGIRKSTKHFELRVATQPTAVGLDLEESYMELTEQDRLLMNRKYYFPQKISQPEEISSQKGQKYNFLKENKLFQTVHVWRLINAIYYIQNGRHFPNDYYNGVFRNKISSDNKKVNSRPFFYEHYKKVLKQIRQKFRQGKLTFDKIIPMPQILGPQHNSMDTQNEQKRSSDPLNFDFLRKYLGHQDNYDSLLENLKFQKMRELLYERLLLLKQINSLFLHPQSFKLLPNPKKYFLIFCFAIYEEISTIKIIRQKYQQSRVQEILNPKYPRIKIRQQLQQQIYGLNLSRQLQKSKKQKIIIYAKLDDYSNRKDSSGDYVRKNKYFFGSIKQINNLSSQISLFCRIQNSLFSANNIEQKIQQLFLLDLEQFKFCQQNKKYWTQIKNLKMSRESEKGDAKTIDKQIISFFQEFQDYLGIAIETKLSSIEKILNDRFQKFLSNELAVKLHETISLKEKGQQSTLICKYFNTRFQTLVTAFFYLNSRKLITYQSHIKGWIIEERSISHQIKTQDNLQHIFTSTQKFKIILNFMEVDSNMKIRVPPRNSFNKDEKQNNDSFFELYKSIQRQFVEYQQEQSQ